MGCETGNDLILSWPYMKYFVDFYTTVWSVTQVKIAQRGPILYV